jgi:heme/copper-type cytochrome/quinol oxidase subunit 1
LAALRGFYGAHPIHLILLLGCFALAAYTVLLTAGSTSQLRWMAVWFACALIGHDLVLFPVYALLDRFLRRERRSRRGPRLPLHNYLRVPALASALLFLVFLPGIIQQGEGVYHAATGQYQDLFLARYLLCVAAFFVISAVVYGIRAVATRHAEAGRAQDG